MAVVITLRMVVRRGRVTRVVILSTLSRMSRPAVSVFPLSAFRMAEAKRLPKHYEERQEQREGGRPRTHQAIV